MSLRQRRASELALTLLAPLLLLSIWELLSRSELINPLYWPAPTSLWSTFVELLTEGDLLTDIWLSTVRILGGFLLGSIPGIVLGLAMGLFWPVRVFLMPLAAALYAIPKIAILPLVMIIFGIGEASKFMIVALSIFFLVVLNTMSGVLEIDRTFRDVARNLGASRLELFTTVALPGALPSIFTGLRLAMGFALIVIVGTEFLTVSQGGIGAMIWQSWTILSVKKMMVGLIITGIMGWLLSLLVSSAERLVMPWRVAD
ncbi:MAG TPA: ABC transporter permease [Thermomicrobiales bacterium]|nr:ABC transporter permease [Thermomicrobiales bacterium]